MDTPATSRFTRRIATLTAPALALLTLGLAAPAHAAGAPTISGSCDSTSAAGQFSCSAAVSGGTAPYTFSWTNVQNTNSYRVGGGATTGWLAGGCWRGTAGGVRLTVTDSTGAVASQTYQFYCYLSTP
ncbi:hypothetical protein GCM10009665_52780 [Kitasatospora nipponensis]|uniref:Ig-like domain-containing protein n=1 Tax=Kitasatospora nipponensis TaxID=258049 RepID=A0ABP4HAB8_9ACTN